MQARQPTYLEAMLDRLIEPTQTQLKAHPEHNPLSVLIALILRDNSDFKPELQEILDNEAILKAGRAFLGLLLENDQLPRGEQLTLEELSLPRGLLIDFFAGDSNIQKRAQEVLSLVERKFSQRAFKQATILLQLFETDQATRMQNERKLFYEDMIQRLGIRRRNPLSSQELERVHEHFTAIDDSLRAAGAFNKREPSELMTAVAEKIASPEFVATLQAARELNTQEGEATLDFSLSDPSTSIQELHDPFLPLSRSFDWLTARHQIHFCILVRHPSEFQTWQAIGELGRSDDEDITLFVPPSRWRSPADYSEIPLIKLLASHLSIDALKDYIHALTKACYFVLLAVGDTGLEDYFDSYFDWLQNTLNIDGTAFVDRLHSESTLGNKTLSETIDEIYFEFFEAPLLDLFNAITTDSMQQALNAFMRQLCTANFSDIAPGHFNLGALVLDHLLGMQYPTPEFAFKVHRII